MAVRPRVSIPRRIFLGFALVLSVSGLTSVVGFVQHERSAAMLSLVHEGYLPLAMTISEAQATQSVFDNLLERVLSERDTASTRSWLNLARTLRPARVQRALDGIARVEQLAPSASERATLATLRRELKRVQTAQLEGETRYEHLYRALDQDDKVTAQRILADLRARERTVDARLRRAWGTIHERIKTNGESAAVQQRQAMVVLAALAVFALGVGVAVTWWSQRVLAPLPRLQARVEAVARGDLAQLPATRHGDDEIGRLAEEFERMVAALSARDDSLHEASRKLVQSERLAAIGRMAAHVTHEVRNPLSSIGLNVELLEEELAQSGSETRELLKAIHREIDSLTAVTEEYLRLARLPNPRLEPEHLGDIVQSTAQFLGPELERSGVRLMVTVEEGLPMVALDENQLRQVLLNLIKNAREAMPEGGQVQVAVSARDGGVVVSVADDGPGMDEAQRERIFDLFYTTKKLGTGLGLPLSQQIVIAHRGQIRCHSAPGEGARFELWFPAHEPAGSERPLAAASASA
jgi:two-component system NtrC family sensor kinase